MFDVRHVLAGLVAVAMAPLVAAQSTYWVDDDNVSGPWTGDPATPFQFIQDGIDAAVDGDQVLVLPGLYVERLTIDGKAIVVRSDEDFDAATTTDARPEITTVDANGLGDVLTLRQGDSEPDDPSFCGFTLTGGTCGVFVDASDHGYQPLVHRCIVRNNAGTGIFLFNSAVQLLQNRITANGGGGIENLFSAALIDGNEVWSNTSASRPAGIFNQFTCGIIQNNRVYQNDGDGVCSFEDDSLILNNEVAGNTAHGIRLYDVQTTVVGNTVTANGGDGLYNEDAVTAVENNIFWNNGGFEISLYSCIFATIVTADFNDVDGGLGAIFQDPNCFSCQLVYGPGNIDADPLFVDVDGTDDDPATFGDNDYHLSLPSPCIDAGNNAAPDIVAVDGEGDPRFDVPSIPDTGSGSAPLADIGADEFHRHAYHRGDATPGGRMSAKYVGLPGDAIPAQWIAIRLLEAPIESRLGKFWLLPPLFRNVVGNVPASGVLTISGNLPAIAAPYDFHLQSLSGNPLQLSNLDTYHIQ